MRCFYLFMILILSNCAIDNYDKLTIDDLLSQGYIIDKIEKQNDGYTYVRYLKKNTITYKCEKICVRH